MEMQGTFHIMLHFHLKCSIQIKRHFPFTSVLQEVKDAKSIKTPKRQFVLELYSKLIQKILFSKCTSLEMSAIC